MAERLIVGMSGASGAPLAVELLRQLHERHKKIIKHRITFLFSFHILHILY